MDLIMILSPGSVNHLTSLCHIICKNKLQKLPFQSAISALYLLNAYVVNNSTRHKGKTIEKKSDILDHLLVDCRVKHGSIESLGRDTNVPSQRTQFHYQIAEHAACHILQ
jgi:hypothetical protein